MNNTNTECVGYVTVYSMQHNTYIEWERIVESIGFICFCMVVNSVMIFLLSILWAEAATAFAMSSPTSFRVQGLGFRMRRQHAQQVLRACRPST